MKYNELIEKLDKIAARYEAFAETDPPCTCTRTDVDIYDVSGCEACDRQSEYNQRYRAARYALDLHGAQDIEFLLTELRLRVQCG